MNVTVNIDDETFSKILSKGVESLDENEIKDITTNAIKTYMKENDNLMEKIFLQEIDTPYYSSTKKYEPTGLLRNIVADLDYPVFQDMINECCDYLKNNYRKLIEDMIVSFMLKGLTQDYEFKDSLEKSMREIMTRNC